MNSRHNFPPDVINATKLQAAFICSNPNCRMQTIAPSVTDEMAVQYNGKVAHISAAAPKGPRYLKGMSEEKRKSISNAIFLCSNCADLIDKNKGNDYTISTLENWKKTHHEWVLNNLNKSSENSALKALSNGQLGGITANIVNIITRETEVGNQNIGTDKTTFLKSEEIFSEENMIRLHSELFHNAMCHSDDIDALGDLKEYFEKSSNCFISPTLDQVKDDFIKRAILLDRFVFINFDKWPYEQKRENYTIHLQPHYIRFNGHVEPTSDTRDKWDKLFKKLQSLISSTFKSYKKLRKQLKIELHV